MALSVTGQSAAAIRRSRRSAVVRMASLATCVVFIAAGNPRQALSPQLQAPANRFGVKRDASKPRSIQPLDATFNTAAPGTIEASLNPPIEGVLRIVVRVAAVSGQPQPAIPAGTRSAQSTDRSITLEVSQLDHLIPFRLVTETPRHNTAGAGTSLLVADIDVDDLTPGVPVLVRVHSNLLDPPDLEGRAYQVEY